VVSTVGGCELSLEMNPARSTVLIACGLQQTDAERIEP